MIPRGVAQQETLPSAPSSQQERFLLRQYHRVSRRVHSPGPDSPETREAARLITQGQLDDDA